MDAEEMLDGIQYSLMMWNKSQQSDNSRELPQLD